MLAMFTVDEACSDEEYFFVDVLGRGTVIVKATPDGMSVFVYPLHVVDEAIRTVHVPMSELVEAETTQ